MSERTLFLAWQDKGESRQWFPIGRLDADSGLSRYRFRYTGGALRAQRGSIFPGPSGFSRDGKGVPLPGIVLPVPEPGHEAEPPGFPSNTSSVWGFPGTPIPILFRFYRSAAASEPRIFTRFSRKSRRIPTAVSPPAFFFMVGGTLLNLRKSGLSNWSLKKNSLWCWS